MHPAGHLASSIVLSGAVFAATRSVPMAVGSFIGGFLIDLDHAFDYYAFNHQRGLDPRRFLDYYLNNRFERVVLLLHSYEIFPVIAYLAYRWSCPWLTGYMFGLALHMALDLTFNAGIVRSIIPFYSFIYRARHGFEKAKLLSDRHQGPPSAPAAASSDA